MRAVGELNDILQRLEPSLGRLHGEPTPLEGGITNRNYRVTLGHEDYVVRLPGKDTALLGIDRQAEREATAKAASLGIAPAVAAALEDCLVTRFLACRPVDACEIADGVEEIALALRRFHESGLRLSSSFWVPDLLDDYAAIVRQRGGTLPDAYDAARNATKRIAAALPPTQPRPCHNDLLSGNLIRAQSDARLMIVDWEYAGMGDPRFDLGNLSVNNDFNEDTDDRLLGAYYGEEPSDGRRAALKLIRVLSDAREGAWGVVQAHISELEFDFEGYTGAHFERMQGTVEEHSFVEWLAAAQETSRGERDSGQTA
jgi:thiamine kinase-like enzyme